jgi:hypothetical protein
MWSLGENLSVQVVQGSAVIGEEENSIWAGPPISFFGSAAACMPRTWARAASWAQPVTIVAPPSSATGRIHVFIGTPGSRGKAE